MNVILYKIDAKRINCTRIKYSLNVYVFILNSKDRYDLNDDS